MRLFGASVSCVVLVLVAGCCSRPGKSASQLDVQFQRAASEARAGLVFTNAILIKPRETLPATNLALTLAPLLIQEVVDSTLGSNSGPATIYYQLGTVQIGGVSQPQMTYLWVGGNEKSLARGVQLTLDSRGSPVIWEVLDDRAGPRVLYVSRSLEERAKAAYGSPTPGRNFAIELPFSIAPNVVVARVIEDGPVAMGPIVHQTVGGEINVVICRCMSPQARQLLATEHYELKPFSTTMAANLEIMHTSCNLAEALRLPQNF
jgi:hypothetical protein